MAVQQDHPILLVKTRQADLHQRIIEGFGGPKEIVPVTPALRAQLVAKITALETNLLPTISEYPNIPPVVTLKLRTEAMAKTHRPIPLLERVEMRPIGTRDLGELLLPAPQASLIRLASIISETEAKVLRANISTISDLYPYGIDEVLGIERYLNEREKEASKSNIAEWVNARRPMILERFKGDTNDIERNIVQTLGLLLNRLQAEISQVDLVSTDARVIRVDSMDQALVLANFPGTKSLVPAEDFAPIDVQPQWVMPVGTISVESIPPPEDTLPIVGVIDTGVVKNDPILKDWVVDHNTFVLPQDTDNLHGTFVAGLVANSNLLNGNHQGFPKVKSKILDISALSTVSPGTSFDEMLLAITESLEAYPDVKVWNCSFGSKNPGNPNEFGLFARELDALSDKYNVLFVIAAGNYETAPLRPWPYPPDYSGNDRISQPAESPRSITVGSVAHLASMVDIGDPSPFSRRGPGPAKTPKPDLTHRGGNCDANGVFNGAGVNSLLPNGVLGESIGTSFSTPIVSSMAANLWQALSAQNPTPEKVKALLIHSAVLNSPKRTAEERFYHGFGIPESVMDTLFCSPDRFTLLFEAELADGINWYKTPFPIPQCLHLNGTHFRGEIVMTLVYSPPLNGDHGAEYIRANVNASFGSYEVDEDGEYKYSGMVPFDSPNKSDQYEKARIENGYKWSPVKVYRKKFRDGVAGKNFRLGLELLRRAGEPKQTEKQSVTIILTMLGNEPGLPVYTDGIKALNAINWVTEKLTTATNIQV